MSCRRDLKPRGNQIRGEPEQSQPRRSYGFPSFIKVAGEVVEIYDDRDVTLIVLDPGKSFGGFQSQKGRRRIKTTPDERPTKSIFSRNRISQKKKVMRQGKFCLTTNHQNYQVAEETSLSFLDQRRRQVKQQTQKKKSEKGIEDEGKI